MELSAVPHLPRVCGARDHSGRVHLNGMWAHVCLCRMEQGDDGME